ncbi:hypothetical protein [Burkholderia cenocepacia]|uniref:hypothetical protein n=1 Tax=Burkholderia cenocepacia TaxID=95486 RepID=UPI001C227D96|nr:hypothetical protein [Burkholderia cenocepacia]MBU9658430.1 hypothetical protein [Burkholderia cenocepacia]
MKIQCKKPIIQSTNFPDASACCVLKPLVEATIDQTLCYIIQYVTPEVEFQVMYLADRGTLNGIGFVGHPFVQTFLDIKADPRPYKQVGEPLRFENEEVPLNLAVHMMLLSDEPELIDRETFAVFTYDTTEQQ